MTAFFHVFPELRALGRDLVAGVSVASVIFVLAASNTLSYLIAGVSLRLYFPYRVGDVLRLQASGTSEIATFESTNLGYTRLTAQNGEVLIVPNGVLNQSSVALVQAVHADGVPNEAVAPKQSTTCREPFGAFCTPS